MKAIYHTPRSSFELCKDLGFTHVNLTLWTYLNLTEAKDAWDYAHSLGLHAIISESADIVSGPSIVELLRAVHGCPSCIIYMSDEPNRRKILPQIIASASRVYQGLGWKTLCVLSDIGGYGGYENCASFIGFVNYEDLTFWRSLKLWAKIKMFQIKNRSSIIAVPPIKPRFILPHFDWWQKWIKPYGFYWFQFHPQEEIPPWASTSVSKLPEVKIVLKIINNEIEKVK